MTYLFLSVLSFAINNVLWAKFAPLESSMLLMGKRAMFTSFFMGLILILAATVNIDLEFVLADLPLLFLIGLPGFMGLYFLLEGFKYGNILQFSIYSLLLTFVLGILGEQTARVDIMERAVPCVLVVFGYLHFTIIQYKNTSKAKSKIKAHLYFFLAHLFFGASLFLQWHYLAYMSSVALGLSQEILVMAMALILVFFGAKKNSKSSALSWHHYAVLAVPISFAVLLGLEGLRSTHPFHSAMIGLFTPIATILLGHIWGVEHLRPKAIVGIALMSSGLGLFYLSPI